MTETKLGAEIKTVKTPEQIARMLGISSMNANFDSIKPVRGMEDALKFARQIATLKSTFKLLMIYGVNGNGKTLLLEAIAIELYKNGIFCRVQTFPDFMARLKNSFERSQYDCDPTFNMIMASACTTPYLLMDDVGQADSYTEFSKHQLERIMLARYRPNPPLFTVMTTNKDLTDLPPMVYSRFSDAEKARLVLNTAPDYRPLKGGK